MCLSVWIVERLERRGKIAGGVRKVAGFERRGKDSINIKKTTFD